MVVIVALGHTLYVEWHSKCHSLEYVVRRSMNIQQASHVKKHVNDSPESSKQRVNRVTNHKNMIWKS